MTSIRVLELPYVGVRINGNPNPKGLKKGFYLAFKKEILAGPFAKKELCYEAKQEWVMPGERIQAYKFPF